MATTSSSLRPAGTSQQESVDGWEIVDNTARLCVMNLYLHGIGTNGGTSPIHVDNSLAADDLAKLVEEATKPLLNEKWHSVSKVVMIDSQDSLEMRVRKRMNMNCIVDKRVIIPFLLFVLIILVSCIPATTEEPTRQPTQSITRSATQCPIPTSELLSVEPVTSPTDRLSQVVAVHIGNGEQVAIITESGTFTVSGNSQSFNPALVELSLLPNTVHHLEVIAKVRKVLGGYGCMYGGYTLRTTRDTQGAPLTIVQGEPIPRQAKSIITVENAGRLEELTSFAPGARLVTDFVFSKDNEMISVGYDTNIAAWNTETGKEVRQLGDTQEGALVVAVNSDGSLIATGGTADNPVIRLWNAQTGDMKELGRNQTYPTSLQFNRSGARLASGDNNDLVQIWDVNSQQSLITLKGDVPDRKQLFSNFYWKDDSTLIAGGSEAIYWWDTTTGTLLQRLAKPAEGEFFVDVTFSQNGDQVAAAAQDAYVYFWDHTVGTWSRWPALPDSRITHVRFSPDGQLLAAGTDQGQFLIWDVRAQELLAHYSMISSSIAAIRFSPDGHYIAVGGWDGPIRLWGIP
ncbi:MAG TPA: N-6 DNA methylase [Anaerolineales bacterium]|nr:N-6 DNA methylase [Anaerolineales bacterium]